MSAPAPSELTSRLLALEAENKELRAQVLASRHAPPIKAGLLYKHRPRARLLSAEWEPRYVTVTPGVVVGSGGGGASLPTSPSAGAAAAPQTPTAAAPAPAASAGFLAYWRHADDAAANAPLGRLDLSGCHVVLEESTQRRLHPVAIVAADGGYFESSAAAAGDFPPPRGGSNGTPQLRLQPLIRFAATDAANAAAWAAAFVEAGCVRGPPPLSAAVAAAAAAMAANASVSAARTCSTGSGGESPRAPSSSDGGAAVANAAAGAATAAPPSPATAAARAGAAAAALGAFFQQQRQQRQYRRTQSAVDYTSDSGASDASAGGGGGRGGGGGMGGGAAAAAARRPVVVVSSTAAAAAGRRAGMSSEDAAAAMRGARAAALGPLSLRSGQQQHHRPAAPQKKAYDDSPSALVHANPRQSVLSVRALVRGDQSGLRNLMAIIVVLANFRLVLENLIKYGVLVSPVMWARVLYPGTDLYMCACWPWMGLCLAAPLLVERWAARRVLGGAEKRPPHAAIIAATRAARLAAAAAAERGGRGNGGGAPAAAAAAAAAGRSSAARFPAFEAARAAASAPPRPVDLRRAQRVAATTTDLWAALGHALAAAAALVVPCWVVWVRGPSLSSPVPGFVLVLCSIVACMKVASFGHCNADLRGRAREAAREKSRAARAAARAAGGRTGGGARLRGGGSALDDDDLDLDDDEVTSSSSQLLADDGGGTPGTPGRANDPQRLSAGGEGTTRRSRIAGGGGPSASSGDEQGRVFAAAAASRAAAARAAAAGAAGGEGLTPVLTTTAELSEEEEEQEEAAGTEVETKEAAKKKVFNAVDDAGAASPPLYPSYPANLTAGNLAYFIAAPTLVYQTGYPRSPGTRPSTRMLLWCSFKLSVAAALQAAIWEQYVMPTIRNSVAAVRARSATGVAERVLKLALPSTYSWVVMFVTLFDCYLTLLAEATRFADRAFFADWWNARTVGQYWRTWNLPVHRFLLRHVFNPLRRKGAGRVTAMTLVFAVSAVLHELAVAVPLHLFRPPWRLYAFWGVLLQVPLVLLTEPLAASGAGNYVFWVSFCAVGQPIGMIMYFCDWVSAKGK